MLIVRVKGSQVILDVLLTPHPAALMQQLVNLKCAFRAVLGSDISERFPRLRWGFMMSGASFTPPVLHQNDLSTEVGAHETILARKDVDAEVTSSIVDTNARRLLTIDKAFTPAPAAPAFELPHIQAAAGGPPILFPHIAEN